MKNTFKISLLAAAMCLMMAMTAMAGEWQDSESGTSYINDDGTTAIGWQWIDNGDGTVSCYYFGDDGYLYKQSGNGLCITPDGYAVNEKGQWLFLNSKVLKDTEKVPSADYYEDAFSGVYEYDWENYSGKYHITHTITYDPETNKVYEHFEQIPYEETEETVNYTEDYVYSYLGPDYTDEYDDYRGVIAFAEDTDPSYGFATLFFLEPGYMLRDGDSNFDASDIDAYSWVATPRN